LLDAILINPNGSAVVFLKSARIKADVVVAFTPSLGDLWADCSTVADDSTSITITV
jgi:hypothetical protein